ncbi:MAG: PAS domain-containing protein [Oscillospiraceae bacterium]|nr:PAS domain-containing protein [Oscillospiraceae bacterium]
MTSKIFRSTLFVAAVILLCSLGIIMGVLYEYSNDIQVMQLKDELRLAAAGTEENGLRYLQRVESQRFRLTWVDASGRVIFDTHADIAQMENHENREEIREAMITGSGSAARKSDEFEQIIQNMQEGLVLLDKNQRILSINPAAKILFNAENDCIGRNKLRELTEEKSCKFVLYIGPKRLIKRQMFKKCLEQAYSL